MSLLSGVVYIFTCIFPQTDHNGAVISLEPCSGYTTVGAGCLFRIYKSNYVLLVAFVSFKFSKRESYNNIMKTEAATIAFESLAQGFLVVGDNCV